jgi:hypothetical protein
VKEHRSVGSQESLGGQSRRPGRRKNRVSRPIEKSDLCLAFRAFRDDRGRSRESRHRSAPAVAQRASPREHTFGDRPGLCLLPLRRALDRGNLVEALASASELEHVGLVEPLELVLLLCRKEPKRYPRAALRWHGRYCREVRDVDLEEGQAVLACLAALSSGRKSAAARALGELLDRRGLERAAEVLMRWSKQAF